jgi:hypothetical protein
VLIIVTDDAGVDFAVFVSTTGLLCHVMVGFEQKNFFSVVILSFPMWV